MAAVGLFVSTCAGAGEGLVARRRRRTRAARGRAGSRLCGREVWQTHGQLTAGRWRAVSTRRQVASLPAHAPWRVPLGD